MEKYLKRKNEDDPPWRGSLANPNPKKPFTIAEELVLPAAVDMCREMIGEAAAKKLLTIPLSNDTVSHRIADMASDIQQQLIERVKSSPFSSLQLDESTDATNAALLLVLFAISGTVVCTKTYCFVESYQHELRLRNVSAALITTSVRMAWTGRTVSGKHHGVIRQILDRAPEAKWTHCFLHRESLAAKNMSPEFHGVMDVSVKTINFIKNNALKSRCFTKLCEDIEADHIQLLYHSEVRWLSRGLVLKRLLELRNEVFSFLTEKKSPLAHYYANTKFTAQLAYLCDIFTLLNQLNISLQGRASNMFVVADKVQAFKRKLSLWTKRAQEKRMDMFLLLSDLLENSPQVNISDSVSQHLSQLAEKFDDYFPEDPREGHVMSRIISGWCKVSFLCSNPSSLSPKLSLLKGNSLVDIASDGDLKMSLKQQPLTDFWAHLLPEHPKLAALKVLMPFPATYNSEVGFSTLGLKTKHRNKCEQAKPSVRLKLSSLEPDIQKLMCDKQHHSSH
uniref:HAT C-terminal dimerisation domain-containing protein n=1 Tax=Echeneis naucrates TaxID=173247 RepID=A0A665UE29_ECHNA